MKMIRPVAEKDLDSLLEMASTSGPGFTSLPADRDFLRTQIDRSLESFSKANVASPGHERYLFVLDDLEQGRIIGCSAIEAACGLDEPFYTYRLGLTVKASRKFSIYKRTQTLYLSNDYTGTSVLCSLFLRPDARNGGAGRLLSMSRFLFIANFPERFSDRLIAELRGVSDADGRCPFWEGLGRHFFDVDYDEAEHIVGRGNKNFIAQLMPMHPIYTVLLPAESRNVIGKVHPETAPARRMLEAEGFRYQGYVDIFDGGPTLEAPRTSIRAVSDSAIVCAHIADQADHATRPDSSCLISNLSCQEFRCAWSPSATDPGKIMVAPELADALNIKERDLLRVLAS